MKTKVFISILGLVLLLTVGIFSSCNSEKEKENKTETTTIEEVVENTTGKSAIAFWSDEQLDLSFNIKDDFNFLKNSEFVIDGPMFSRETGIFETKMVATNTEKNKLVSVVTCTNMNISKNDFVNILKNSYNEWTNVEYGTENILGNTYDTITITQPTESSSMINHIYIAELENNSIVMLYIAYPENTPEVKTEIFEMFE